MAMVVKNNMSAVRTLNTLNNNSNALQGSLAKVSSGMKINSAQDDASGYAISERMRVQIRSLDQANQNTQNGSSLMKTAEGAVSKTVEILKSLKEKAISAATDTNTDSDRVTIQKEIDQFIDQIDDNALVTFNGKYLVDGSKTQAGKETFTAMTNQSLAKNTNSATALTKLANRNNESLEIASTDYVTASFVKDGKTFTTKFKVQDKTLEDIFKNLNAQYKNDSGKTDEIFGPANTNTAVSDATFTKETAATKLNDADPDDLLAAAKGDTTNANAMDIIAAAKYLRETEGIADYSAAITGTDLSNTSLTDATTALQTQLEDNLKAVKVSLTATGDSVQNAKGTLTASFKDGYGETLATTASNTAIVTSASTGAAGELTVDAADGYAASDLDTIQNSINKAAADAITNTSTTYSSVADAVEKVTTLTINGSVQGAATGVTLSNEAVATNATIASDDAKTEAFEKAYLIDDLIKNAGKAAGGLVNSSSDVGVAASGDMTSTANGEVGLTVTANTGGLKGQISGLAISISDSEGNVKKSANASLDAFSTTIFAANGSDDNALKFHVGATANLSITVGLADMRSEALGLKGSDGSKVSVATQAKANAAVATFDNALQKALDIQTTIGAVEARLDYTSSNLTTSSENVQAAESTIRDADMAKEMTAYTKNNVLLQAAQSMLAQANQNSSAVLSLLQ